MRIGAMGKIYPDGSEIVKQGEVGNSMYIVQKGEVEVVYSDGERQIVLSVLGPGDVFGDMALFTKSPRSATVRAKDQAIVLTIDKQGFLKRVHEDPSFAFLILKQMSERILKLDEEVSRLKGASVSSQTEKMTNIQSGM
jgi:CRP/FNR family transcriptional regulator, cyclic AMP receptor protein